MRRSTSIAILALIFLPICTVAQYSVFASTLDDLEESATQPKANKPSTNQSDSNLSNSRHQNDDSEKSLGESITIGIIRAIGYYAAIGGYNSWRRYQPDESHNLFRLSGDPLLPRVKLETSFLSGEDQINAQTNSIELGYGFVGASYAQHRLFEPSDSLTLKYAMFHYRMSFGNSFRLDFALGEGRMRGDNHYIGSVFSLPVQIRFNSRIHLDYTPVWSSFNGGSLADHRVSLNYHVNHVGLKVGYQRWSAQSVSVNGIFAGLYAAF